MSSATSCGTGCVFSLTLSATGRGACGAPYGVRPRRSSRRGSWSRLLLTPPIVGGAEARERGSGPRGVLGRDGEALTGGDGDPLERIQPDDRVDDVARVGRGGDLLRDGPERIAG